MIDKREAQFWLEYCYPTTIIKDRYNGAYSGAKWLAFPNDYYQVPKDIDSGDIECMMFWKSYTGCVGKGNTVEEAFSDLVVKMKKLSHEEIEKPKKERAELEAEMECYAEDVGDEYNIYDQFNYECDQLWQLITRVCLNANPPIKVREHTLESLKEAGVHCTLKVEGGTSKLELWRGDELVGVIINTKPKRVEIGFD